MFEIKRITSDDIRASELYKAHWEEIAHNKEDIPLDPDWEAAHSMEQNGMATGVGLFVEQVLVGYAYVLIHPHFHYKSSKFMYVDLFYVSKEWRGNGGGVYLAQAIEWLAIEEGAVVIQHHVKPDHPHLGYLIKSLGYTVAETIYQKKVQ